SQEVFQKFNSELNKQLKKANSSLRKKRIFGILNRAAIAVVLMVVLLFATVSNVQAIRNKVLNLFINVQSDRTSFQLKDSGTSAHDGTPVVNWTNAYVPTYLPEGYEISNISSSSLFKKIEFTNQQNKTISYSELDEFGEPAVDTEKAEKFETIDINGRQGNIVVKNPLVAIVWETDGCLFMIQAPTSEEDTAIEIARSVKYIE
ncbi:MAG: DUF4367 domain-containing protein, partial [Desulfitobacterium sp.]|nr:DUF4367 domain-containing protein [Desulfitobacterium sp.]